VLAAALKKAQREKNEPEIGRLSLEIFRLQQTKRDLGKRLGERIVVR